MVRNPGDQDVIPALMKFLPEGLELPGAVGKPVEKHNNVRHRVPLVQEYQAPFLGDGGRIRAF
jgi:hypothetical protein